MSCTFRSSEMSYAGAFVGNPPTPPPPPPHQNKKKKIVQCIKNQPNVVQREKYYLFQYELVIDISLTER